MSYVIGQLEDNAGLYLRTQLYNLSSYFSAPTLYTHEPITYLPLQILNTYFDPLYILPLFTLLTFSLNVFFIWRLYKHFFNNQLILWGITVIAALSPFLLFKLQNHPALFAIWPMIWGITYLIFSVKNYKSAIFLGGILALTMLISNYYGYFLGIFIVIYSVLDFKKLALKSLTALVTGGILAGIFLAPYIYYNTIGTPQQKIGEKVVLIDGNEVTITGGDWKINNSDKQIEANPYTLDRPLEDFFYFTARPWYYILWPVDNPFYGSISEEAIEQLQNKWGHWLTQNYFMREHSASFLGITNIIMAALGLYYIFIKKAIDPESKTIVKRLIIVSAVIFLITLPPFITFNGLTIYLPSYLLYLVFPMFRSLVRLTFIISLFTILISGFGYQYIFSLLKNKILSVILVVLIMFAALSEFIVPIGISNVSTTPEIFSYIKNETPAESVIALYPEEDSNLMLFWTREHKRMFINPKGYKSAEFQFDSEQFTDKLITCEGIIEAHNLGVTHILVLGRLNKEYKSEQEKILSTNLVEKIKRIDNDHATLFEINKSANIDTCNTN